MTKKLDPVVFFGNEKLATGINNVVPVILNKVIKAGFEIEQHLTGKLSELRPHKSKIAVLAAYGRIIPQRVLDEFPLGIINVHPSLLPKYRGPTPIEQAILDGVPKTGVSIMRLTAGMDEGPIYKQKSVAINNSDTKEEIAKNLQFLGGELLAEVLPQIAESKIRPHIQPHPSRATYSHIFNKADGIIDWHKPAQQLEREIRAFAGWPGSRTALAGKDVIITKARVTNDQGPAGKTKIINKDLVVFTSQGALVIELLKPAGKKEMASKEFLAGYGKLLQAAGGGGWG